MSNDYYNASGYPAPHVPGVSASLKQELAAASAGFDKLPALAGNPLKLVRVNAAGSALESFTDPYVTSATVTAALALKLDLTGGTLSGGLLGTTLSLSSTLGVSGATTLAALTATTIAGTTGTFSGDILGANVYVGTGAANAGTYGISGGNGASVITWGTSSAGLGRLDLYTGSGAAAVFPRVASAVNYFEMYQSGVAGPLAITAAGSDTNIGVAYVSKGGGSHIFYGNSILAGTPQFAIAATASANRYLIVSGSNGAAPTLAASAGGLLKFTSGTYCTSATPPPPQSNVGTNMTYAFASGMGWVVKDKTGDNRVHEFYNDTTAFYGRWLDDAYGNGSNWLAVTGGYSSGTSSILMNATDGLRVNSTSSTTGLHVHDTGGAGANIKLTGNDGALAKPVKYLRATADEFQVLSNDYGTALLTITEAGKVTSSIAELGFRGLPSASVTTGAFVAADAGKCVYATAGVTVPNTTMAAGDIVVIQNTTGSSIAISAPAITLRQTGTANTGARTLLAYGRCAVLFSSSSLGFISGDVT